jgi:hypothetical protein
VGFGRGLGTNWVRFPQGADLQRENVITCTLDPPTMLRLELIITSAVAVTGLALSVYNTVQARQDKRPKLRVNVSFGFLTFGRELSDQKIIFEVGNPWNQNVTLASLLIPLPNKKSLIFFDLEGQNKMPHVLAPGTSTRFWIDSGQLEADTIKGGIRHHGKFEVVACDALGNKYRSNPISFKPVK